MSALLHNLPLKDHLSSGLISKETLDWVEDIREKYSIQGISIGIIASPNNDKDGWRRETHGFGYMDEKGRPIDGEASSNSKLFAAIAIGMLIEDGTILGNGEVLDYNTKIKVILPSWQLLDQNISDHVDVLDLLAMRSGMPRHDKSYGEEDSTDILARLPHLRSSTEIRQVMQYNNIHYWVIGEIVAYLGNCSYAEYVQTRILDPLGMSNSYYDHTVAAKTGQCAESFVRDGIDLNESVEPSFHKTADQSRFGRPFATSWFVKGDGLFIAPVGGLVSSTEDMMIWLKETLAPATISRRVIDETHKSIIPAWGETIEFDEVGIACYGQAQMTFNYRGHEVINHIGDVPGQMTHIARLPTLGVGIFLGFNDDGGHLVHTPIMYRLLDDLLGLGPIDWEDRLNTAAAKSSDQPPVPDNPRAFRSILSLPGTYYDQGYGALHIQELRDPDRWDRSFLSDFATGTTAQAYLEAITKVLPQTGRSSSAPVFFAHVGKLFVSAYVYAHFDGPIFNVWMINVKQNKAGELTARSGGSCKAVFVQGQGRGVGMFENFWGGRHGRKAVEEDVEAEAEVWFRKMSD